MSILAIIIIFALVAEVRETMRNSRDRAYRQARVAEAERRL